MEKIRVNMTPCEEVKTIHASQGDNATRKWAFDLYDENGKIDSSDIKEQMIFDSRVGGTEQILPENTSNPTTSPIIADIQYPDSLRSEQTFLYRESPNTVDGQAKITKIKGNTVVFNQLVQNGNFADTSEWLTYNCTLSVSNNVATITDTGGANGNIYSPPTASKVIRGHKYYCTGYVKSDTARNNVLRFRCGDTYQVYNSVDGNWHKYSTILTAPVGNRDYVLFEIYAFNYNSTLCRDLMCIDITAMGIDNLTTTAEVEAWLSSHIGNLPYYAYTTGKLLPFKGESLKTTGKNLYTGSPSFDGYTDRDQWDLSAETYNGHEVITKASAWTGVHKKVFLNVGTYTFSVMAKCSSGATCYIFITNWESTASINATTQNSFTIGTEWAKYSLTFEVLSPGYVCLRVEKGSGTTTLSISEYQLEFGSSATDYEPYTTSTLSLPISTYFSTGMKSAGSVYDELTESKAITRIGSVDLGSLTWYGGSYSGAYRYNASVNNINTPTGEYADGLVCSKLIANGYPVTGGNTPIYNSIARYNGQVYVYTQDYTSANDFKTAMSGQYLYYELGTPTEESITTASLVTEKGEAPLYFDDELIADCNETISSESGIFDAKIKLMDDETIYSQKIQLHIEKAPN